ncbi:MAG: PP2C family protein-serine/threonine phosphatase [Phycisphaerae bacterium]|nr:PP2C family protein-serine/threonine phosphatase [Phycisphaerae bacterium]MDD5380996.1 PP2C family protein-serine/threonine phosphatase [Phycisphaerae bacterium]
MEDTKLLSSLEVSKSFTDVLYLANQNYMPSEVKRLLRQKKLSFAVRPLDTFFRIRDRLDLIGTVIIDTVDLGISQQGYLSRIIESLEMNNIGVILLNERMQTPVKSFSLSPAKSSFSMTGSTESVSVDELWVRISLNLAYRKKSSEMAVKPAMPPKQVQRIYKNKLAEQLGTTGALVDNLSEQFRLAGLVQQDFLPAQLPNTDRVRWATTFLPAEWVSGDIYDVVRIDEQHIGFYVADVVGHGIPAALLTIFLKQALVMRETVDSNYHIFSPVEVMKNLNVRLAKQKLSGYQFATCCYALLNTETLQLTYARAGHPYPILIRPNEQPQQLEIRGSLLGIFAKSEYIQQTIQLQPGDKILVYSDGAEPFIGSLDDSNGFNFSEEFCGIKDLPLVEMMDKFSTLLQNLPVAPPEIDDITAVALEIL